MTIRETMTIREAIAQLDNIKPNVYDLPTKVKWLESLDLKIKTNIIDTHVGGEAVAMPKYSPANIDQELLVGGVYDEMYIHWLKAMIDLSNNEYDLYNNEKAVFESLYVEFENYYNRTHMPISKNFKFF